MCIYHWSFQVWLSVYPNSKSDSFFQKILATKLFITLKNRDKSKCTKNWQITSLLKKIAISKCIGWGGYWYSVDNNHDSSTPYIGFNSHKFSFRPRYIFKIVSSFLNQRMCCPNLSATSCRKHLRNWSQIWRMPISKKLRHQIIFCFEYLKGVKWIRIKCILSLKY